MSDWANKDFFSIMELTAIEVLSIAQIIQGQIVVEESKNGKI